MQSGLPVSVNVTIERGASVSGTVLFDDGSPAIGLNVTVLAHSKNSWVPFGMQPVGGPNTFTTTDDQGNYRIARLPARDYLVQITFSRSTEIFHFDERGRASSPPIPATPSPSTPAAKAGNPMPGHFLSLPEKTYVEKTSRFRSASCIASAAASPPPATVICPTEDP